MRRILVTGASGFIGRHALEPLLVRDFEVHGISRKPPGERVPGIIWHAADLLEPGAIDELLDAVRPTHLLHAAWIATPQVYRQSPENLRWLKSSLDLLETFLRRGGKRIVGVGTCAEYDWRYGFCSERFTPCLPATLYGGCKHAFYLAAAALVRQHGLPLAWARVFFPYGPGEHPSRVVPHFVRTLLQGEALALPREGEARRDFVYVEDVGLALAMLADNDVVGVLNIASGQTESFNHVADLIAQTLRRDELLRFEDGITLESQPGVFGDCSRLSNEVGFHSLTPLEEGLRRTVAWWRENV